MDRRLLLTGLAATAVTGVAVTPFISGGTSAEAAPGTGPLAPAAAPPAPTLAPPPAAPAQPATLPRPAAEAIIAPQPDPATPPPFIRYAVAAPVTRGRPIICVVIDDLGVMHRGTERVLAMPAPLTLSWFPFAPHLPEQVAEGLARGHEATLHMPMQSFSNSTYQTGPDPLRIDLPPEVNLARLRAAMAAVPSAVGLNNHMGSVATHDAALMALVARETRAQGMLFLDSLTIGGSQGFRQADAAGVPAASRDYFIDNTNSPAAIATALGQIEAHARRHGNVIAIGHPRPHTVEALEAWLPTLPGKGFVLWPLAATIALRLEERRLGQTQPT
jgi:polysaccharide deacetylase 2 family uncharacterized protein YibQ